MSVGEGLSKGLPLDLLGFTARFSPGFSISSPVFLLQRISKLLDVEILYVVGLDDMEAQEGVSVLVLEVDHWTLTSRSFCFFEWI